jgi:signal transduction histidine kinase
VHAVTESVVGNDVGQLADLIRDEQMTLMEDWKQRVRRLRSASELDAPGLTDHMPEFLTELAESIRLASGREIEEALSGGTAPVHGIRRVKEGYEIEEVVAEYGILRACIHDLAEGRGMILHGILFHVLNRAFDAAIGAAVRTYAESQSLEVQRRREEYLAFVAHDLRTPLNAISLVGGLLERMRGDQGDSQIDALLATLRRNTRHVESLVSKVLDENSQLLAESGVRLERRVFELWPLVEATLQGMGPVALEGTATLVNAVPYDLTVNADAGLLERIFQNLIANAIGYAPKGKVSIGAREIENLPGAVECWVSDDGEGIPDCQFERIFEKTETDGREGRHGSGLGLAIVRKFVEGHGGKVCVESEVGRGTTFRFTIPAVEPHG